MLSLSREIRKREERKIIEAAVGKEVARDNTAIDSTILSLLCGGFPPSLIRSQNQYSTFAFYSSVSDVKRQQ